MSKAPNTQALVAAYSVTPLKLLPLCDYEALSPKNKPLGKTPKEPGWIKIEYDFVSMVDHMARGSNVAFRLGEYAVVDWDCRRDPAVLALTKAGKRLVEAVQECEAAGTRSVDRLCAEVGIDLAKCFVVLTGGYGLHIYMRLAEPWRGREQIPEFPGCEWKHSPRRYVVAAGSLHPGDADIGVEAGRPYTVRPNSVPLNETMIAPSALLMLYAHVAPPAPERGTGESTFGRFAGRLSKAFLSHIPVERVRSGSDPSFQQVMMAAHWASGGEDRDDFVDWCISDPPYADQADDVRRRWDSCSHDRPDSIKTGLLFKMLEREGVQRHEMPVESASIMFEGDELDAEELEGAGSTATPPVEALPPGVSQVGHLKVWSADALRRNIGDEPPGMDGLFNSRTGSIYVIYGPPGHGKTQASGALGKAISRGDTHLLGQRLYVSGDVLFFALDDEDSILKSELAHTLRAGESKGRFDLIVDDPRFEQAESWPAIEKACAGYRVVIIDTLATALPTGDPDKSNFVSQFYTRLKAVGRKVGCFFVILHHTPKDQPTVARNAGSIIGNANGSICIHKPDGDDGLYSEIKGMKVRGERSPPIYFAVESVEIGYDELRQKTRTGGFVVPVDPKELKSDRAFYDIADCVIRQGERRGVGEYVMTLTDFRERFGRRTHTEGVLKDWPGKFTGDDFEVDFVKSARRNEPHVIIVRGTLPQVRRETWKAGDTLSADELQAHLELAALKADPDFSGLV